MVSMSQGLFYILQVVCCVVPPVDNHCINRDRRNIDIRECPLNHRHKICIEHTLLLLLLLLLQHCCCCGGETTLRGSCTSVASVIVLSTNRAKTERMTISVTLTEMINAVTRHSRRWDRSHQVGSFTSR